MQWIMLGYRDRLARLLDVASYASGDKWSAFVLDNGYATDGILERLELGDDRVAFRTLDLPFLEAIPPHGDDRGQVVATAGAGHDPANTGQMFLEVWVSDHEVGLRTFAETYLTAENDGKAGTIVTNRGAIGPWERFQYVEPPRELLRDGLERYRPQPVPEELAKRPESLEDRINHAGHQSPSGAARASHVGGSAGSLKDKILKPPR